MARGFWNERENKKTREGKITAAEKAESKRFFENYLTEPGVNPRGSITHLIPSLYSTQAQRRRYEEALAAKEAV